MPHNWPVYEQSPTAYDVLHEARGKDYAREAADVAAIVRTHRPAARSLLDVASGTGLHLAAFAGLGFDVEGVELSPAMIEAAKARVPEAPIHEGDMRTFRLDRRFDAVVCLFSAIGYMTDPEQLAEAIGTMGDHLVEGGVLVVEPWYLPEEWHDGAVFSESADKGNLAVARVSRSWREKDVSLIEMRYAIAAPSRTWSFTEVHRMGLFSTEEQLFVFRRAGLDVEHHAGGLTGRGLFVAVNPVT